MQRPARTCHHGARLGFSNPCMACAVGVDPEEDLYDDMEDPLAWGHS
jgi:hypothetical protein